MVAGFLASGIWETEDTSWYQTSDCNTSIGVKKIDGSKFLTVTQKRTFGNKLLSTRVMKIKIVDVIPTYAF